MKNNIDKFTSLMNIAISKDRTILSKKETECRKVFPNFNIKVEDFPLLTIVLSKNGKSTPVGYKSDLTEQHINEINTILS